MNICVKDNNTNLNLNTMYKKIIFFALIAIAMLSCTPKSAMTTKAVVLQTQWSSASMQHKMKVKYLSYGVVDVTFTTFEYEVGDTIFIHDKFQSRSIK